MKCYYLTLFDIIWQKTHRLKNNLKTQINHTNYDAGVKKFSIINSLSKSGKVTS